MVGTPVTGTGIAATATALCTGNDDITGGGYDTTGLVPGVNVTQNIPVDNTPDRWQTSVSLLPAGATLTAYAVCAVVPG
ncbi:hypothetical protein [Streptomyces canus]|uniref:hypothetical protein n=1 Tax=Streptomyces canus TaxID=58343 RepID=UPI0036E5EC0E